MLFYKKILNGVILSKLLTYYANFLKNILYIIYLEYLNYSF